MTPWRVGIVGAEASKFTAKGAESAKIAIRKLLDHADSCSGAGLIVISGECPKGGVDIWAKDIALEMLYGYEGYTPAQNNWDGYKTRNLKIVDRSDDLYVITPRVLPNGAKHYCYHCRTDEHVRNGGCWTAKQFQKRYEQWSMYHKAKWILVKN